MHDSQVRTPGNRSSYRAAATASLDVGLQRKLTVGSSNDPLEAEADAMADRVMRMPDAPPVQRKCAECEEEDERLQRKPLASQITPFIQAKADTVGTDSLSDAVTTGIETTRGGGSVLPDTTRGFMESRFGVDFSEVKIHTDQDAIQMNRELNAKAFTVGSDIYFNEGQYQPGSDRGRYLLAHELTHSVQQGGRRNYIQRRLFHDRDPIHDPLEEAFSRDTGIPRERVSHHSPEYEAWLEQNAAARERVREAVLFLNESANYFQVATVDQALLDQVLPNWNRIAQINIGIIRDQLHKDSAELQSFQTAFNNAVRTLFTRAAAQIPNTTVIQLYLSNLYRLPDWARPDVASFNLSDDAQRRTFITNLTDAFNINNLFQGYTRIDEPTLQSILAYLLSLVTDTQNIIADNLANDPAVLNPLKDAYRNAVDNLLTRASTNIGSSVLQLFMRYRYGSKPLIHEWADQTIAGTSAAAPLGTASDPITGNVTFTHNGFEITIEPDGTQTATGAMTHANMQYNTNMAHTWTGNTVTGFTPPATPQITIRTDYGPGSAAGVPSGYGRGTTVEDVRLGNTSLGYHERSHSRDYLRYIENHPAPVFTGAVGMTKSAFAAAETQYVHAMQQYNAAMNRASELATDCVGSPNIVQYHTAQGTVSTVACP